MNQKTLNQRGVLMTGLLAWSYLHAIDFSALSKRKANQTITPIMQSRCGAFFAFLLWHHTRYGQNYRSLSKER